MKVPLFKNKVEALDWLKVNKNALIVSKTNTIKHGDVIEYYSDNESSESKVNKAFSGDVNSIDTIKVKSVINSCGVIDSHMDCHMTGIWKKSLNEKKVWYWLQEHDMDFDKIIADSRNNNIKALTEEIPLKQLGIKGQGSVECLVFEGDLDKRNEFMFKQYAKGYVLNHSVGMRYVKLFLCVNSEQEDWKEEKQNWDKYYPFVLNKEIADDKGYFWAVTEAKFIEGSAVVIGSNQNTPTLEVEETKNIEPLQDTHSDNHTNEPLQDTQQEKSFKLNEFY